MQQQAQVQLSGTFHIPFKTFSFLWSVADLFTM